MRRRLGVSPGPLDAIRTNDRDRSRPPAECGGGGSELKCDWYGWRAVSSRTDGFFRNADAERVRTGAHRHADLEVLIDAVVVRLIVLREPGLALEAASR